VASLGAYDSQLASSQIISKYIDRHMLSSSDMALHNFLVQQRVAMLTLQGEPDDCRRFFLGYPVRSQDATNQVKTFLENISNAKAEVVESSVSNPSLATKETPDAVAADLMNEYRKNGYAAEDLGKVSEIANLPPVDACRVGTEFTSILASFDPTKGWQILKNLILAGAG
jgi:hypothetical protein